jgi:archaellum biogenesis protein FlaJ (TadC family)
MLVTVFSATQLMPGRPANIAILISFVVAIFVIVFDQFTFVYRLPADEISVTIAVVLTGFLVLGYAFFLVREF